MKRLLLLRHAKSSWDGDALPDFDRPLVPRGHEAAARIGRLLAERELVPDRILCSTARRARETCDGLVANLSAAPETRFDDRLYLAAPATLLRLVHDLPDAAGTALVIGHNPGLQQFVRALAGSGDADALERLARKYPTAALALLNFDCDRWQDIAPGEGRLETFVAPRDFP